MNRNVVLEKVSFVFLGLTLIGLLAMGSCKSKQKIAQQSEPKTTTSSSASVAATQQNADTPSTSTQPKTTGKVSHQYRADGCSTVVLVVKGENTITLIPIQKLPESLDVDGLEITFNYHTLKVPQPKGCLKGIPASLKEVEKK